MLTKRIIPCLDVKDGRVVKGVNFVSLRDAGDPVSVAESYNDHRADELVFLDITASYERRSIFIDVVKQTAEKIFMPLTVGGGIGSVQDIRDLLNAGADKVSINTAAVKHPNLIRDAAQRFGSQCIVVAIDAKRVIELPSSKQNTKFPTSVLDPSERFSVGKEKLNKGQWEVFTHGGRTPTGKDAVQWAQEVERLGAGEILLTSMDYDGTKNGFDLALTKSICRTVNIPVIASGGAGTKEDFYHVFAETGADAALAASVFHYGEISVQDVKEYLKIKSIEVRL